MDNLCFSYFFVNVAQNKRRTKILYFFRKLYWFYGMQVDPFQINDNSADTHKAFFGIYKKKI